MFYRCVATSVAGFVQQVAVGYITKGYYFYVTGKIPAHKNPAATDRKLIERYGIEISKWSRARRKKCGLANVQYLRFDRFFVIMATHGQHPFFEREAGQIHDIRKRPILFMGYSIGCRRARSSDRWHASVRIEREKFLELKAKFEKDALRCSVEELCREFRTIPFEPYAPVRDQMGIFLRSVNRRRKASGLELMPSTTTFSRRRTVKPFL